MRLVSLTLQNFRRFRNAEVHFPEGIIGIIGENGSGKSTLIEAIAFALYGSPALKHRGGKENVRTSSASSAEPCSVTLKFDFNGHNYEIMRELKGVNLLQQARLIVDGMVIADSSKAVDARIEEDLNMRYEPFRISVYAMQKETDRLIESIPSKRKELVMRLMGLEDIDRAIAKARERTTELRSTVSARKGDLERKPEIEAQRKERRKELSSARKNLVGLESSMAEARETVERLEVDLEKVEEREREVAEIERRRTAAAGELKAAKDALARIGKDLETIAGLEDSIPDLKARTEGLAEIEERMKELARLDEVRKRAERVKRDIETRGEEVERISSRLEGRPDMAGYDELITKIEDAIWTSEKELETAEEEERKTNRSLGSARTDAESAKKDIAVVRTRLDELEEKGPDSVCPECERPLEDHYDVLMGRYRDIMAEAENLHGKAGEVVAERESVLRDISTRIAGLKDTIERARKELEDRRSARKETEGFIERRKGLVSEIDGLEAELKAIGESEIDPAEAEELGKRLDAIRKARDELVRTEQEVSRKGGLVDEEAVELKRKRSAEREIASLEMKVKDMGFSREDMERVRDEVRSARKVQSVREKEFYERRADVARLEESLVSIDREIENLVKRAEEIAAVRRDINLHETLRELLRGFRTHMIGKVRGDLMDLSSEWLSRFTDGRYSSIEIDGDYNVSIVEGRERYDVSRYSGGEVDAISLSLRMAISGILTRRSGAPINMVVLDEVFGSQDESRRRAILTSLSRMKGEFGQIVLISHVGEIRDSLEHVFSVETMDDGSSVVVEA